MSVIAKYKNAALFVLLTALIVLTAVMAAYVYNKPPEYPDYTTYSSKPQGTRALYLLSTYTGFSADRYKLSRSEERRVG